MSLPSENHFYDFVLPVSRAPILSSTRYAIGAGLPGPPFRLCPRTTKKRAAPMGRPSKEAERYS